MTTDLDLVVLTGQSNAGVIGTDPLITIQLGTMTYSYTALDIACAQAESELGLSGSGTMVEAVCESGTLAGETVTDAQGTVFGNSSLIPNPTDGTPSWFNFVNGDVTQGITQGTLEDDMNAYLQNQYAETFNQNDTIVNKVVVIDAQNENDELNPNVVTQAGLTDWEDAVLVRRADIATDLHQSPSAVPMALLWVPSNQQIAGGAAQSEESGNAYGYQSGGEEYLQDNGFPNPEGPGTIAPMPGATYNLHAAEQALEAGTVDEIFSAGNYGDASMAGYGTISVDGTQEPGYINGNLHFLLNGTDDGNGSLVLSDFMPGGTQADIVDRLTNSIINLLGGTADTGPLAQWATVSGDNEITVAFSMYAGANTFDTLSGLASLASGWTLNNSSNPAQIDNFATSAEVVNGNSVDIFFSDSINTSDLLFYEGLGDGHITFIDYWDHILDPDENMGYTEWNGQGAAIYDSNGIPIQVSAFGLQLNGEAPAVAASSSVATATGAGNGLIGPSQDFIFSASGGNTTLPGGNSLLSSELTASIRGTGIPQTILDQLPGSTSNPVDAGFRTQDEPLPVAASLPGASIPNPTIRDLWSTGPLPHSSASST